MIYHERIEIDDLTFDKETFVDEVTKEITLKVELSVVLDIYYKLLTLKELDDKVKIFIEKLNSTFGFSISNDENLYRNEVIHIEVEYHTVYDDYELEVKLTAKRFATDEEIEAINKQRDIKVELNQEYNILVREFKEKEARVLKGEKFEDVFGSNE